MTESHSVGNGDNVRPLSDEDLVASMRAGDSAVYDILVRRYDRFLHYMTLRVVHDDADAEDLVQEAHLKAFKNLRQFAGRASFATWLTTIAVRGAISHVRKPSHRLARRGAMTALDESDGCLATAVLDPEQQLLRHEARRAVRAAVAALPPRYRAVIVLRGIQQLTTEETARQLGVTTQSVKMRVYRAKALLRADLIQRLGPREGDNVTFPSIDSLRPIRQNAKRSWAQSQSSSNDTGETVTVGEPERSARRRQ